jgi:hypothetical protein
VSCIEECLQGRVLGSSAWFAWCFPDGVTSWSGGKHALEPKGKTSPASPARSPGTSRTTVPLPRPRRPDARAAILLDGGTAEQGEAAAVRACLADILAGKDILAVVLTDETAAR